MKYYIQLFYFSAQVCTKRLKTLKDEFRKQIKKLPLTRSGSPAFHQKKMIKWPYFDALLFMKDEFVGRSMVSSGSGTTNEKEAEDEENKLNSDEDGASEYTGGLPEATVVADIKSPPASTVSKKRKSSWDDRMSFESKKLEILQRAVEPKEDDASMTFAKDIANDLRQIQNPMLLARTKMTIKNIVTEAIISEMNDESSPATNMSQPQLQHFEQHPNGIYNNQDQKQQLTSASQLGVPPMQWLDESLYS